MAKSNYLRQFIPMVDALGETFGKHCEVVLHDLSTPETSIIAIANGHVTGRQAWWADNRSWTSPI